MTSSALDIAALDCEMIYTTGGFRVARVSVVDASGKEVFDELIKMDDGVEPVCVVSPYPSSHPSALSGCLPTTQGFEHTLLRHSPRRIRNARGATSRVRTACVSPAHRCGHDPDRALARQ